MGSCLPVHGEVFVSGSSLFALRQSLSEAVTSADGFLKMSQPLF